jgi:hypothetical protein
VGIIILLFGIIGTIYYGSEFIKSETMPTTKSPYTNIPNNSNTISMVTEIRFVILVLVGFGIKLYHSQQNRQTIRVQSKLRVYKS